MTKVLYVDDERDIAEIAAMALELDPWFEVQTCNSGAEALAFAREWRPDVVLLDVMMPQMDGPETLRRLAEQPETAGVPVLFITARTQVSEVARLRELGAVGVIPKPFDPMTLAATVRAHLP
ncbi:MAG: response regulator [Sphingomonas sp.]|uniref:response regulator n=1 Tax=Sphingomonas sp. TaxID=28214 RepID=UPI001B1DDD0E|nr:response regulator [Sphingomonas sp.]MBO9624301.1 response regulator [Sphingomonas sp.]